MLILVRGHAAHCEGTEKTGKWEDDSEVRAQKPNPPPHLKKCDQHPCSTQVILPAESSGALGGGSSVQVPRSPSSGSVLLNSLIFCSFSPYHCSHHSTELAVLRCSTITNCLCLTHPLGQNINSPHFHALGMARNYPKHLIHINLLTLHNSPMKSYY